MPDLFYPALGCGFVIGMGVIGWIVGTQLKRSYARVDGTGEVIVSSPPRPPLG